MERTLLITGLLLCMHGAMAQPKDVAAAEDAKISLFVGMVPGMNRQLDDMQLERLRNKTMQCASRTGMVQVGMSNFLLYPALDIQSINVSDAGMKRIMVAKCEVVFSIARTNYKDMPGAVFNTLAITAIGSGFDSTAAINSAIQAISPSDVRISKFIEETKAKILQYYMKNCNEVILEARRHYELQQHGLSIGLLFSVPVGTPCYDEARTMSITVYKEFLKDECEQQLLKLKAILTTAKSTGTESGSAQKGYAQAVAIVSAMNPAADCYQEAYGMLNKLENDLDEESRRKWDLARKVYESDAEVKKEAYRAIAALSARQNPMVTVVTTR